MLYFSLAANLIVVVDSIFLLMIFCGYNSFYQNKT